MIVKCEICEIIMRANTLIEAVTLEAVPVHVCPNCGLVKRDYDDSTSPLINTHDAHFDEVNYYDYDDDDYPDPEEYDDYWQNDDEDDDD